MNTDVAGTGVEDRPTGPFLGDLAAIVVDPSGQVDVAEGAAAHALGAEPEALVGRSILDLFGDRPAILLAFQRALAGRADRVAIDLGNRSFELHIEPRRRGGALAVAVDVSALRRAEQELHASESYLSRVFRQIPGGVWATDRDLRITYFQGRVLGLRGIDPKQVVGMRVQDFVEAPDPTEPALAHHLAALAGARQAFRYHFRGRWFEILLEPLLDAQGRTSGCIGAAVDVTERRRFEEELALSRRRLEEAQRLAHVGSFEWDVATNAVTWSEELHRIYGVEPGRFGGTYEAFLRHVHPDDLDHTKGVIFEAFRRATPFVYDHRVVRPDGSVRVLHTRGDVIADGRGKAQRVVGCCWDVTEFKELEARRERALSLLEGTLNATADGLLVVDLQGRVAAYNDRLLELWKLSRGEIEHQDFEGLLALVDPQLSNAEECLARVRELATRSADESFDSLRFCDGRFYERYSRPQRVGNEIVGRVWSYRDVTDRERLLRRAVFLADAARLLASLDVEPALDGVAHLAVPFMGDGCAIDLLGNGAPRRAIAVSRDPTHPINPEVRAITLAGHSSVHSVGPLSYIAVPLIIKGEVIGAMTFVAAPTRRYSQSDLELAEELARRVALAVENARLYSSAHEALRARDEFLSIAAHEIRGPITSMHLAVQGLRQGKLPAEAQDRVLEIIEREDGRLGRFVDELLDVGRIRSGQLRFELEEVDLGEVVREVAARCGPELMRAGSALSVGADRVVGFWDRFRVEQVVTNLLMNAIRFGLGKPIDLSVTAHDGRAVLSVRDRGLGIPAEAQPRIFQPFERGVSSRHYGGLGLGLFIVRTIVDGLGGTVSVESRPGEGSKFVVELPQKRSP